MPGLFLPREQTPASPGNVSFAHALSRDPGVAVGALAALPFPGPLLQFAGTDDMQ
jgi:hypothetical protein